MALTGKWTAKGFSYVNKSGGSIIEDESGNGNHAIGSSVNVVYMHRSGEGKDAGVQAPVSSGSSVGTKSSFKQRGWDVLDATAGLGFNGHSFMRILNNDAINLPQFTLSVSVGLYNLDKSQYIIDKRNGQWHRNYCMLYASQNFPHLRDGMDVSSWFLADIGDGKWMEDDFHNGVFFSSSGLPVLFQCELTVTFDGSLLVFWWGDRVAGFRQKDNLGDITGSGDLVVGDAGFPHSFDQWPVGNSHTLYGKVDKIEIYDTIEKVVSKEDLIEGGRCLVQTGRLEGQDVET